MARRRKEDLVLAMAQLVGLVFALGFVFPPFRAAFFSMAALSIGVVLVVVLGLLGFVVYRRFTRSEQPTQPVSPFLGHSHFPSSPGPNSPENRLEVQIHPPQSTGDIIRQLHNIDWFQFEKVVEAVFRKVGFKVERRGGANPDGGIDLVIEKDGEPTAVQCKHWKKWNVGVKTVRELLGALTDSGFKKGALIILGGYTGEAKQLADKHGIEIINETELARLLEAAKAGTDPEIVTILQSQEKICPKCEQRMVLRTAKKGLNPGSQFWGCSAYPKCRFTMPA